MLNTSKTIEKTSTVYAKRCAETKANMKKLMEEAGRPEYRTETVMIPLIPGSRDDVLFVGYNGAKFYFLRGKNTEMPTPVAQILRNAGVI